MDKKDVKLPCPGESVIAAKKEFLTEAETKEL